MKRREEERRGEKRRGERCDSPAIAKHELLTIQIIGIEFRKDVGDASSSHDYTRHNMQIKLTIMILYRQPNESGSFVFRAVSCYTTSLLTQPIDDSPVHPLFTPAICRVFYPSRQCNPNTPLLPKPLNPPSPSPKPPTAVHPLPKPRFTMTSIGMKCTR